MVYFISASFERENIIIFTAFVFGMLCTDAYVYVCISFIVQKTSGNKSWPVAGSRNQSCTYPGNPTERGLPQSQQQDHFHLLSLSTRIRDYSLAGWKERRV